ncbi:hypothetical protein [Ketobacter sp.]|uniref:NAD(P)H-dependent amine dehydrogenase family protein n=1 Tax=Ketobacter sp. TaxID=2083498 RepID=UPI0025B9C84D|nr:hypothetical protein [Ketobacter sp.]
MSPIEKPFRVVQWTTGKVASEAAKTILERPELELVGAYAFSEEKHGQDLGDLLKLGRKLNITATHNIDELIALKPDCVAYMPLHPNIEHMETLLRAGINIATTASFMTGYAYGDADRARLEAAAQAGQASLFGSGINPGWVDNLTAAAAGLCKEVNQIRILESFNIGLWAGDANQDGLGWGRPANDPGHADAIRQATLPFGDAVETIAAMFDFPLDEVRCDVSFAHASEDLDVPGRTVKAGTVAGIMAKWLGIADDMTVIDATVQWSVGDELDPPWDIAMAYLIEVEGTPQINLRVEVLPDLTLPEEELMTIGFMFPANPVVNAIPAVVMAPAGIVTYADLKPITSRMVPKPIPPREPRLKVDDPEPAMAVAPSSSGNSVEGTWHVTIKAPTGNQETQLVIQQEGDTIVGVQKGQSMDSPIHDAALNGNQIQWINHVSKPFKLKVKFNGTVDGNRMTGKCKAGIMGTYPFTAIRQS